MNDEYLEKNMSLARLYGAMHPAFVLLAGVGMVTVLWLGGALTIRGTISVGSYVAFGLYLGMLTWPLIALGWVLVVVVTVTRRRGVGAVWTHACSTTGRWTRCARG